MQFLLTGFTSDLGFRVFAFEGIAADRSKTDFTVRADLALIRGHGIRVQELPLLCRGLLEQSEQLPQGHALTLTAEHMREHAEFRAAESAAQASRKSKHRRQSAAVGKPA